MFLIMFGLGLNLKAKDFSSLFQVPRILVAGVLAQLLLLPLLALLMVLVFSPPAEVAVGIMIVSFAPGGATSNLITHFADGDTAFSIVLTTLTSLITPFTMPILTLISLSMLMGEGQQIDFPVLTVMMRLLVITLLPVLLGILVNYRLPVLCSYLKPLMKRLSILLFFGVVVLLTYNSWGQIQQHIGQLAPLCLALAITAMGVGYGIGRGLKTGPARAITLTVEIGIQNAGTALLMTVGVLNSPLISIGPLVYGILMQIPALGLVLWVLLARRKRTVFLSSGS
ncbi:MAG: bile acid:sodium symporter [Motiliproteus sp.]|nr:bile acid:sodium symporter [Motiliproteus sp.]MCW9054174.1 bile acid:sodium symporter [Motiliproteus sp.]